MSPQTNLGHLNILLAEDDAMNVIVLTKFLQRWGVVCDVARNGKEAVEKCQSREYDVILMDMYMPVMTGIEATKLIREFNKEVKIFALTADTSAEMREQTLQCGLDDFVTKPFNPEELYQKLICLKPKQ
jgi:CheY-like chemotaxis protein